MIKSSKTGFLDEEYNVKIDNRGPVAAAGKQISGGRARYINLDFYGTVSTLAMAGI